MLDLQKLNSNDRIKFKNGFQARIISLVLKELRNNNVANTWRYLGNILGINYNMISNYKNEQTRLSVRQLLKLINFFPFLKRLNLEAHITSVETLHQIKSRAGRLGGKIGGQRVLELYPGVLQSRAKLASIASRRKYGNEYFNAILRKYCRMGGFSSVEKSEPTPQMRRLIIQNGLLGFNLGKDFEVNYTIKLNNSEHNVDFVYFRKHKIILVEEATNVIPYNKIAFAKVLNLVELKKWFQSNNLSIPILFTFNPCRKRKSGSMQRFPILALLSLLQNGIIPIIDEDKRPEIIKRVINNENISDYLASFWDTTKELVSKKIIKHRSLVNTARNKDMTESERIVHNKLTELGLKPQGKVIIDNEYKLTMEVDNFFIMNGEKWLVLVTKTNSKKPETVANHVKQHAGLAFIIKNMFNPSYKILSVILADRELGNSKWTDYLYKYADKCVTKLSDIKFTKNV